MHLHRHRIVNGLAIVMLRQDLVEAGGGDSGRSEPFVVTSNWSFVVVGLFA
jgi:hypothetical protein